MAPLIQDSDFYISSHDDVFGRKSLTAPLHETTIVNKSRRVSFGAVVTINEVMSRFDYTHEELEASWFDRESNERKL